jgi:hypothetical protein
MAMIHPQATSRAPTRARFRRVDGRDGRDGTRPSGSERRHRPNQEVTWKWPPQITAAVPWQANSHLLALSADPRSFLHMHRRASLRAETIQTLMFVKAQLRVARAALQKAAGGD